jgi:hemin uptake protein HemP
MEPQQPAPQPASETPPIGPGSPTPRHDSLALFAGGDRLIIEHRGDEYLLRITRQGKLILTK